MFGQPLEVIVTSPAQAPITMLNSTLHNTTSSPLLPNLEQLGHASSPSSPTRVSETYFEELNTTANSSSSQLFDPYTVTSPPSPRALRRQALTPSEQQIPTLVKKAIEHLDTKGVKLEGLFRIPGSKARIAEVCMCMCVFVHVCVHVCVVCACVCCVCMCVCMCVLCVHVCA